MFASSSPNKGPGQQTLFCAFCTSASYAPFIHPEEAWAVASNCMGRGRKNILTCQDVEALDLLEVGGLSFENINLSDLYSPLSQFIPIIPRDLFSREAYEIPAQIVGVTLNDILTKPAYLYDRHYKMSPDTDINTDVLNSPVFRGKSVILFSSERDIIIETLWWRRGDIGLFRKLSEMGFLGITGMNFSLIVGECPLGHALNLKKSLVYSEALSALGAWSIPHVYAFNRFQRERWREWLLANPHVRMVVINCQLQRNRKADMEASYELAEFLLTHTGVSVILHGRGAEVLQVKLRSFKDRIHIAASGPCKQAAIKRDMSVAEYISEFANKLI